MSATNKNVVREWLDEMDRRKANPEEMCTPDFAAHFPGQPSMNLGAYGGFLTMMYSGLSEVRHDYFEFLAEGDRVAVRYEASGVHRGELMGAPPTGKEIRIADIAVVRVEAGRVAEMWASPDLLGLMRQMGALPAPAEAPG